MKTTKISKLRVYIPEGAKTNETASTDNAPSTIYEKNRCVLLNTEQFLTKKDTDEKQNQNPGISILFNNAARE